MRFQPSHHSYGTEVMPPSDTKPAPSAGLLALGIPVIIGILTVPTFVINPWIVKAFKPEWSYWRRVGAGMGITAVAGMLTRIASAGADKK